MLGNIENFIVFNRIFFWVLIVVLQRSTSSRYPYPVWGSPYQSADHYWPLYNITDGILEDVEGAAHTVVYNGAKIVQVPQLGHALSLDGKDDWVDTGGFNADCVTEPSTCKEGFTLAFWLRVYGTGYVMSSGSFTNHRNGPGYQLYYQQSLKRFKFLLETRDKRWTLLLHEDVGLWTHMAFTWREQNGLSYYEDGNLSTFTDKPVFLSALREQNYTPVITLARPSNLMSFKEFGKFEISQFAIWLKELSAEDIAGVYQDGLYFHQDSVLCCHFKSVKSCVTNPCQDTDQCLKTRDSVEKCLCPSVNLRLKTCKDKITGECEDKSTGCRDFAAQSRYCEHRKMRQICPRSCDYCATEHPSTTLKPTLKTASSSMSRVSRESKKPTAVVPTNSGPAGSGTTSKPTLWPKTPTRRRMPRGESCEVLECQYYARCFQTPNGYAECRCPECHSKNAPIQAAPVCGDDDKSYLNMCVLKLESCLTQTWIRKHEDGFCGARFTKATHYLPLNGTRADKKLIDLRGNVSGLTENGVKPSTADQIGQVLTLDGEDSFIELKNIKDQCIVDPTLCREGLSVAFWIKYNKGKFIISSGQYTSENFGPGFRFICESCSKNKGPHINPSGRFLLELSTLNHKWTILLDSLPRWWFHFAFTWNHKRGLKFYKNGKLAVSSKNPEKLLSSTGISNDEITIGKANSLWDMITKTGFGDFSIGHLAIWTYELSKFDVEIAFLSALTKTIKSMVCCQSMKADPCFRNPCRDGATCQRMEDKFQCICADINMNRDCSSEQKLPEPCEDKSADCTALASQDGYCQYHWRRMKTICPKACKFCGDNGPGIRTSQALTYSRLKTNAPIMVTTQGSPTVGEALQTENRNTQSTRKGVETHNLQTLQSTSDTSTMSTILSTMALQSSYVQANTEPRMTSEMISTTAQVQSVASVLPSTVRETPQVSPSSSSAAVPQDSSRSSSTAVPRDLSPSSSTTVPRESSTLTSSNAPKHSSSSIITPVHRYSSSYTSTAVLRVSTSLTSTAFDSYTESASTTQRVHTSRTTTVSSFIAVTRFTSVQPSFSSSVTVPEKAPLTCKVKNVTCVCFNCEQARKNGQTCCVDIVSKNIQQGVKLNMRNITVEGFYDKISIVSRVIAEVILDSCTVNSTLCFSNEKLSETQGVRKRRSPQTDLLKNDSSLSNIVRTKRDSDSRDPISQTLSSSVVKEALRPVINPSKANISRVDVIIYSISSMAGHPQNIQTAFYVTVTSFKNGTNQTQVVDGKGLLQILRDKKQALGNRLNITIDSFSAWQSNDSDTTSSTFLTTLVPNPSPGSQNLQTSLSTPQVPTTAVLGKLGDEDNKGFSQSTLILIICAAIGGLVLLVVLLVFILTRFYRQRKGEFVPDKNYPNSHSKQNGEAGVEDVENIASFIDPSAPRITDVPHKPSRAQSSAAGGGGANGKKARKPMGVKVTYKPPKWD
ncbi:uncharacterized protein LOC144631168 isoform X3 [Oculina patagonica]